MGANMKTDPILWGPTWKPTHGIRSFTTCLTFGDIYSLESAFVVDSSPGLFLVATFILRSFPLNLRWVDDPPFWRFGDSTNGQFNDPAIRRFNDPAIRRFGDSWFGDLWILIRTAGGSQKAAFKNSASEKNSTPADSAIVTAFGQRPQNGFWVAGKVSKDLKSSSGLWMNERWTNVCLWKFSLVSFAPLWASKPAPRLHQPALKPTQLAPRPTKLAPRPSPLPLRPSQPVPLCDALQASPKVFHAEAPFQSLLLATVIVPYGATAHLLLN